MLLLKKQDANEKDLKNSQIGFSAIEFLGNDILSDKVVVLNRYKGKYVYMDFWGSCCGPCLGEIPHLEIIFDKIDSLKIDLISVVEKDKIGDTKKAIIN